MRGKKGVSYAHTYVGTIQSEATMHTSTSKQPAARVHTHLRVPNLYFPHYILFICNDIRIYINPYNIQSSFACLYQILVRTEPKMAHWLSTRTHIHTYVCTYVRISTCSKTSPPTHAHAYVPGVLLFSCTRRVGRKAEVKVCGCIASEWRMVAKDMAAWPCTSTGADLMTVCKWQDTEPKYIQLYKISCVGVYIVSQNHVPSGYHGNVSFIQEISTHECTNTYALSVDGRGGGAGEGLRGHSSTSTKVCSIEVSGAMKKFEAMENTCYFGRVCTHFRQHSLSVLYDPWQIRRFWIRHSTGCSVAEWWKCAHTTTILCNPHRHTVCTCNRLYWHYTCAITGLLHRHSMMGRRRKLSPQHYINTHIVLIYKHMCTHVYISAETG